MRPCANAEITSAPGSTYEFLEVWLFHHIVIIDNMMFKPNVKQNTKATQKQTQQHRPAGLRGRGQGVRHRHGESFILGHPGNPECHPHRIANAIHVGSQQHRRVRAPALEATHGGPAREKLLEPRT